MKKLLGILVIGLLLSGNAYAHDNPKETKLTCEYIETYYRNWDGEQFGETINDESAVKSIYFNIIKREDNEYVFKTNMHMSNLDNSFVGEKLSGKVDDNNYSFYILKNTTYISIELNRYNGRLTYTTGHTNDDSKYLIRYFYDCEKAEQKF